MHVQTPKGACSRPIGRNSLAWFALRLPGELKNITAFVVHALLVPHALESVFKLGDPAESHRVGDHRVPAVLILLLFLRLGELVVLAARECAVLAVGFIVIGAVLWAGGWILEGNTP